MRRVSSTLIPKFSCTLENHPSEPMEGENEDDTLGNMPAQELHRLGNPNTLFPPGLKEKKFPISKSYSSFKKSHQQLSDGMTSRPSFISLMLIASDDEWSRIPRLPAPLQVETDVFQKCGWEDEPKVCSHLPILHPQESDDEQENSGIINSIIHLPERMRKISSDRQRFNVFAISDQEREQLKNLYVY